MSFTIPDEVLRATGLNEQEMAQEIAVMLFEKEKLTLAQAARLAGLNRIEFQQLLASRQIPVHYGLEELEQDLQTLRKLGRL
jgi:predicted HTH domain antitoxin